ncbi:MULTISPECIES: cytochrome P450 [unclassified Chelatococcus]|uniref:cytochrome P450 n=1 Tax=unclassified Chelatococcus TaxID=2638111 RepID=UPI001BCF9F9E|nr:MULTISPECIES: cytochrome P450 [unclassified Chelatococcus]MBS7743504.1 cytochrome P450 [Chelatococcus sp. HY11]MBX3547374.1 cytochrome P450 [Chelatococcus sp.]CAH1662322.1 conserved hypothetical protein [Hyphomicrobiales bacterium]CAH1687539.1 conserved hypothetical protein [Hyphomicrobiales bacterium]
MTFDLAESYLDTVDTDPHPFYEELRSRGDVVWDDRMNAWLVVGAEALKAVMMDDSTFAQPYLSMKAGEGYRALRLNNPRSFQFLTGDLHRAMHRWWLRELLSPQWVARYREDVVVPVVKELLDGLEKRDTFDIVDDYAERIPVAIFARLMDLPDRSPEQLAIIKGLNDRIAEFANVANSLQLEGEASAEAKAIQERAVAAAEVLNAMLLPLAKERKAGTGTDFISRLWAGGKTIFPDWNETDTLDACRRLLFAGSDTTTLSIANGFNMLLTDPKLLNNVRSGDSATTSRFVEEVLRLNGSVQFRPRRATVDAELGGQKIASGDMVISILQAANRDPAQFQCPHAADLDRKNGRTHYTFNTGPRSCPGANLARAELIEAIGQALERFPNLALVPGNKPALKGFMFRSYRPIWVKQRR